MKVMEEGLGWMEAESEGGARGPEGGKVGEQDLQ